ncbi:hypothetical protein FRB97_000931 [Tulasnella sp. 331]|nr:hypothetical protein FRB97_000931 [Tulasnella sp. 331]KAG8884907.1 hypothetical protein FRB98_002105 [Tulasnella sp. 332]
MPYTILVGAYSKVITTLSFDPSTSPATLKVVGTTPAGSNPSWVATHPTDKSLVFASNEGAEGKVLLFKAKPDGTLDLIQEASSGGAGTCHLHIGESEVVTCNYSSGSIQTFPLSLSPPALLAPTVEPVKFEFPGTGPSADRQESSHPHQIYPHPSGEELLVPDLGSDKIWRLKRDDKTKAWTIKEAINTTKGAGPRHVVVKGNGLYVVNELKSTVTLHSYPEVGEVKEVKTIPGVMPPDELADNMLAAEILLTQPSTSFPETLIYVSNRNDPHPEGDTIAIFTPGDASSGFELVAQVRTGLHHVRGVAFGGEEDKYVVVGGLTVGAQIPGGFTGGGIKVYERVDKGRSLKEIAHLKEGEVVNPTGFVIL